MSRWVWHYHFITDKVTFLPAYHLLLWSEMCHLQIHMCVLSRFSPFDSLWPHGLQHARLPCPLLTPGACSNSCPLSHWWHPTISSSVVPFSSCPQSFPASGSFQMSQMFVSGGQNIGVSASTSVLPMNTQDLSLLGWTGCISFRMDWLYLLAIQGTLKSLLQHHSSKASILLCSAFFILQLSHPYMTSGKTIALNRWTFVDKVILCTYKPNKIW